MYRNLFTTRDWSVEADFRPQYIIFMTNYSHMLQQQNIDKHLRSDPGEIFGIQNSVKNWFT